MSETQDTRGERPMPLRRFRPGAHGAMVEDERGAFIRHDDLIDWLGELESKLHAYEQNGRAA